jgi:fatty-acyl-CoA synthase
MFIAALEHPDFARSDLSSLRTGVMAGAPCPIEVMKRVAADMHMGEVTICYGMTETSPVSFQSHRDDSLERRVATVGRVHPHVECKIVDPHSGNVVPRGRPASCARATTPSCWDTGNEAATREAIDAARWMHTGDLAVMDGAGCEHRRPQQGWSFAAAKTSIRAKSRSSCGHPALTDVDHQRARPRFGEELCA